MKALPRSLQGRLLALVLGAVAAAWIASAALAWRDARHELDELLDGHLAQAAALLVVQQAIDPDDDRTAETPTLHRYAPRVAFQVFDDGQLALRSANAPAAPMAPPGSRGFHTVRIGGEAWRVFVTRGQESDVEVQVGELAASRASVLRAVLRAAFLPALAALPLLALAVAWAVRGALQPLRRLRTELAARAADDLRAVDAADAPAEIQPLVEALNALFERARGLLDAERRFTADAAHELRTPIAAIRAQAQVALDTAADDVRRHALAATLQGCDRAARLVDQLLTLARLEARAAVSHAPVDLPGVVRQAAAELAQRALARGQHLCVDADARASALVAGDETLLGVLARNLIDNALGYSPEGATVRVRVRADAATVALRVDDSGPGLAEAELARLGERFFRPAGRGHAGSGLGWSIVRRIAACHHATTRVGRSTFGGLSVEIDFPAGPPRGATAA